MREALTEVIASHFVDTEVVSFESLSSMLKSRSNTQVSNDLIVISPGSELNTRVHERIGKLNESLLGCSVVLLVDELDREYEKMYFQFNLQGLIPNDYSSYQVVACLKLIMSGVPYFPEYLAKLRPQISNSSSVSDELSQSSDAMDRITNLTPRQKEVMRYIATGKSNKYIAAELDLCESTIKVHVSEVMRKLEAKNRTHALYIISKLGEQNDEAAVESSA